MIWPGLAVALLTALILIRLKGIAMDINQVQDKIAALKASVDALLALPASPPAVDLQPLGDAIDAIKAEVDAKLPAPSQPAP